MGLLSILGRFLFASFFILSACLTFKELNADPKLVEKEYAAMMAGPMDLIVWPSEEDKMTAIVAIITVFTGLKVIGGFLIIFGLQISVLILGMYLLMAISILCGFYHYEVGEPKFNVLLQDFVQNVSLLGALMFFVEMKFEIKMRQLKKKVHKSKRL